ncbi:hypothetical protein C8R43DRAFT_1037824, partial [Mycena crocata]
TARPPACPRTNTACPPLPLNRAPVALSILRRAHQSVPSHCRRSRTRPRARESAPRAECAAACCVGSHPRHAADTRARVESRRGETAAGTTTQTRPAARNFHSAPKLWVGRPGRFGRLLPAPCACQAIEAQRGARTRSRCGRAQARSVECERGASVRSRGSRIERGMSTQLRSLQLCLPGGDFDPVHAEVEWRRHAGLHDARRYSPSTQRDPPCNRMRPRPESRKWRRRVRCVRCVN